MYNSNITNGCTGNHSFIPVFQKSTYTCSSGYYLPANTEGCRPCTYGHACAGGTYTFDTTDDQGIIIGTYTCNSGYYLPANAVTCVACPNGATCSGGTFTFNTTTAQGIVVNYPLNNNITNGCSKNLTGGYIPVFVPNSISLTWQDENGTTVTTNTCSYGTTITLPPNPTKPGYKFTGWKVVNN